MKEAMLIRLEYTVSMAAPLLYANPRLSYANAIENEVAIYLYTSSANTYSHFLVAIEVSGNKATQNMTFPPT